MRDGGRIVGASTGLPLAAEHAAFRDPVARAGIDVGEVFYCAESVLLPDYRGRGLGAAFFDVREAHARALGLRVASFCAVIRPADHPAMPPDYRPLDSFWRRRGYAPVPSLVASYSWRDLGAAEETAKPLQFWMKGSLSALLYLISQTIVTCDWITDSPAATAPARRLRRASAWHTTGTGGPIAVLSLMLWTTPSWTPEAAE